MINWANGQKDKGGGEGERLAEVIFTDCLYSVVL